MYNQKSLSVKGNKERERGLWQTCQFVLFIEKKGNWGVVFIPVYGKKYSPGTAIEKENIILCLIDVDTSFSQKGTKMEKESCT